MKRFTASLVLAFALCVGTAAADVAGNVIMSRGGAHPMFVWDATPGVKDIVEKGTSRGEALRSLEAAAIELAKDRSARLNGAKDVTVIVMYSKTGDVSPVYQAATFTGVERLFTLVVSRSALAKNAAAYERSIAGGNVPKEINLKLTGELPPK